MSTEKCRTCYRDVAPPEIFIDLDTIDFLHSITLAVKLKQCVPELEINSAKKEKICKNCTNLLASAYRFRKTCLHTEGLLKGSDVMINAIKSEPTEVYIPTEIVKLETDDVHIKEETCVASDITEINSSNMYPEEADRLYACEAVSNKVITGDISVGFEITNAKEIHNTVSVSITTNTEKAVKKTQMFKEANEKSPLLFKTVGVSEGYSVKSSGEVRNFKTQESSSKLSDIDIIANFFGNKPKLHRANFLNCFVKLKKLSRKVSNVLMSKRTAYVCHLCEEVILTRVRFRKHNSTHLRRIAYAEIAKSLKQCSDKLKTADQSHNPRRKTSDIKTELQVTNSRSHKVAIKSEVVDMKTELPNFGITSDNCEQKLQDIIADLDNLKTESHVKSDSTKTKSLRLRQTKQLNTNMKKNMSDSTHSKIKREAVDLKSSEIDMQCQYCNITFHSLNIYNLHMKLHPTSSKASNEDIAKLVKSSVRAACKFCKKGFGTRAQLYGHMSAHSSKRIIYCACGLKFMTMVKYNQHQSNVHGKKKAVIRAKTQNYQHTKKKNAELEVLQSEIPSTSNVKANDIVPLKTEMVDSSKSELVRLSGNITDESIEDTSVNVECKICCKTFNSPFLYNSHVCVKANELHRMFKCQVCQYYFFGRTRFIAHVKGHLSSRYQSSAK